MIMLLTLAGWLPSNRSLLEMAATEEELCPAEIG